MFTFLRTTFIAMLGFLANMAQANDAGWKYTVPMYLRVCGSDLKAIFASRKLPTVRDTRIFLEFVREAKKKDEEDLKNTACTAKELLNLKIVNERLAITKSYMKMIEMDNQYISTLERRIEKQDVTLRDIFNTQHGIIFEREPIVQQSPISLQQPVIQKPEITPKPSIVGNQTAVPKIALKTPQVATMTPEERAAEIYEQQHAGAVIEPDKVTKSKYS